MKKLIILAIAAMAAFADFAQEPRKVVLVVKDNAKSGLSVQIEPLASGFTAALASNGFQVVNPYDDIGQGAKSIREAEVIRDESPIGIARRKKADGIVIVSVDSLESSWIHGLASADRVKYEVCMVFRLLDTWGEGTICSSDPDLPVRESMIYNSSGQKDSEQKKRIGELLRSAGVKCAKELLKNPELRKWTPTPPPPRTVPPMPDVRSEFDKVVDKLTDAMLSNSNFSKEYNKIEESLGRKPRALIGGMKNKTARIDFDSGLEVAGKRFLKKLYDSAKFGVLPDDQIATDIAERLVKAVGTEKDDLIDELKQHGSPDLYVVWELIHSADLDGTGYYNFVLTISHLRKPGGVFWTDLHALKLPLKVNKEVSK